MARNRVGSAVCKKINKGKKTVNIWYGRITYFEGGKRVEKRRRAESKSDAKEIAKQMLRELDDHGSRPLDAAHMTFGDLADYYKETYLQPAQYVGGRKISGLRALNSALSMWQVVKDYFGKKKLRTLTHGDIAKYRTIRLNTKTIRGKQRSITSVNRELELIRRMLNIAVHQSWIIRNPFNQGDALINKADETKRERILTKEEEERLLAACTRRREHIRPIIICALDTGMRHGEILKLKWADVDFTGEQITVQAFNTKTMRERQVGITDRLARELQMLYEQSPKIDDLLVFGIEDNVKKAFDAARRDAGLPDVRFHDLRHTYATRLNAAGISLPEIGRILGHTQANTTYRYVNANAETVRRAAAVLNAFNQADESGQPVIN
ncbi:MAG TPA: site-specific integrase [Blastocatellia bacterium]|nr:site-specific integrase [Blastocatellia bacterium]